MAVETLAVTVYFIFISFFYKLRLTITPTLTYEDRCLIALASYCYVKTAEEGSSSHFLAFHFLNENGRTLGVLERVLNVTIGIKNRAVETLPGQAVSANLLLCGKVRVFNKRSLDALTLYRSAGPTNSIDQIQVQPPCFPH
jgi:hypothetical protein